MYCAGKTSACLKRRFASSILHSCNVKTQICITRPQCVENVILRSSSPHVYRGADKSLARPGRKQATATKLLTFASNPPPKKSEGCPSNQVSAAEMTSASDEKFRPLNCFFFSSRVGLRTYQHSCIFLSPHRSQYVYLRTLKVFTVLG